jgi:hypothetical protein
MSSLLDLTDSPTDRDTVDRSPTDRPTADAAQHLRHVMAAVRVMFTWFGTRRSLTSEQKAQAADAFGAEGSFLSAGKKLIDTSHCAFKAVTSLRSQATGFWRSITVPFPEPGVRLIRRDDIGMFEVKMTSLRADLAEAVANLDEHYGELKSAARRRLGRLYNPSDYPDSLSGLFAVAWEYPNVEPPHYLRQLSPALYEEEARRVAARFDEAVRMAEEAFTEELSRLVTHLTERLSGQEDGKPKIFRDSAVANLTEFFERFRHLNVRSSEELDNLVQQAQRVVRGVEPQQLRDDQSLRQQVATQLSSVQATLDGLLVDRPRRNILRRPR